MSFFSELKRRNIFRVGIAYVLMGWVLLQGIDFALDLIDAPNWVVQVFVVAVIAGLPVALLFAWIFEITPEGLKRDTGPAGASAAHHPGHKLDRFIILFLVITVALLLGDRFLGQGEAPDPVAAPGAASSAASVEDAVKSIAVLPFVNMSADAENEFFSDGISEEILNVLAAIPELQVAARTSTFVFKGSPLSISDIAGKLGVSFVLEGSVRKAGNQVRITAQLIRADNGFHLWSGAYDRELTNIFAIQDEIAQNIASVLEVQLLGEQKSFTTAQDLSPENYEKFLKARFLMRRRNDNAMLEAIGLSRAVLADAPNFPRGLIQLAECLANAPDDYRNENELNAEMLQLTEQALALDPQLAAGYMMKGYLASSGNDLVGAIRYLRQAIELDPSEPRPHHWLGIYLSEGGYLLQARKELALAVELEPDHANANGFLAWVELLLGDYDSALQHYLEQNRLGNPGYLQQTYTRMLRQEWDEVRELAPGLLSTGYPPERVELLLAATQDPSKAEDYSAYVLAHPLEKTGADAADLFMVGQYATGLRLMIEQGRTPRFNLAWSDHMAESRSLPEFDELMREVRMYEVWDELGPPEFCRKVDESYDCSKPQ